MGGELAIKLAVDAGSAGLTALAVAPLIAAFDEAITKSASGGSLWGSLGGRLNSIVSQPAEFFGSVAFIWMWIVYAATYATSNSLKSIEASTGVKLGFLSTFCVTIVNMSCGIAKDAAYAKLFGSKSGKDGKTVSTPPAAYFTWFLRDLLAFTFILTLPPIIKELFGMPEDLAKFTTPVLAQYFTTPLHLLGFNMCNMPGASLGQQFAAMRPGFFSTVAARQLRIIPPYSIGGILNGKLLAAAPMLLSMAGKTKGA